MHKSRSEKNCDLCGLTVGSSPFSQNFGDEQKKFCCLGCLNVFTILTESGVIASGQNIRESDIFKRSLSLGLISRPENAEGAFQIPADAPVSEMLLHISGMWCTACSWLIENSLKRTRGVVAAEAFFTSDLVRVRYCPQFLPPDKIKKRIEQLGYTAGEFYPDNESSAAERRDMVLRIGVAGFLWLNIMTLSVPLYVGYFQEISPSVRAIFPFILMLLATPVIVYSAKPIISLAWKGLLNRTIRMETLLATGILAAFAYSSLQALRGETLVYFDTAAAIVTLVLLGKMMEKGAKERTTRAISMLYRLRPKKVRTLVDGAERFVSVDALNEGDTFVVKAGERIPADGIVVEGESYADESLLTGESNPVLKIPDSVVVSGSVNTGDVLRIRATLVGQDSTLSQIIALVERAIGSRSHLERAVDKVSKAFVPSVIVVSVMVFAVSFGYGFATMDEAVMRAVAVLVIACPCALGLATPLAITAAVGTASRHGVLVSDSSVLEKIRDIDAVAFDKTGTVTVGKFDVVDVVLAAQERSKVAAYAGAVRVASGIELVNERATFEDRHLGLIASLEKYSEHPLGKAMVRYADNSLLTLVEAKNVKIEKGLGISGEVRGKKVFVGNRRMVEQRGISIERALADRVHELESSGKTVSFFAEDGILEGAVAFGDALKPEATEIVSTLKQLGIRTFLVSGDSSATTKFVANQIGVDEFQASALPADKIDAIEALQGSGLRVAMIGDGINDAPALAKADLGIAMGSGADIAMKAADIVLAGDSLEKLLFTFDLSKRTWRIVRQNLFWAFFYNTLGMSLAATGILTPIMAAGAMLLSSLSVIGNTMRLNRTRGHDGSSVDHQKQASL